MASETNELTFVRCPTCRSLVPASASRCRICNATLEAGGEKTSTTEPSNPGSRVRQKTVTASAEEIKSIVGGAAAPPAPVSSAPAQVQPPPSSRQAPTTQKPVDEAFDPLGAFLQDLDSDEPPAPAASARPAGPSGPALGASPSKSDEDLIADLFGDDDEDDDDLLLEGLGAAKQEDNEEGDDEDDDDEFDIFDDPSFEELGATTAKPSTPVEERPAARPAPPEKPVSARPPEPPRRPVPTAREELARKPEPSRPPQGPRDGQKQPRPEQKQQDARPPQEQRKPQPPPAPRGAPPMGMRPKGGSQPARPEGKTVRPPVPPVQPPLAEESEFLDSPRVASSRPERDGPRFSAEPREERAHQAPQAKQPQQPRQPHPRPAEPVRDQRAAVRPQREEHVSEESVERSPQSGPRMHKMKPGRLFGWLVSFESPDGRAIELRSGRFFVTGTSIRGSDLILEDQSISTPHALMSINEKGFLLQDLMSERGTFVRSRGEAQYRREEGIIEVQHGDWIRFGDVEFLVTIVPG